MRAVVLAGGESSRFWPLNSGHKSLTEVCGLPLIARTIQNLPAVDEVVVVESPDEPVSKTLSEMEFRKEIEYRVQKSPKGMWDALLIGAEDYGDDVLVVSGHHFSPFALGKLKIGCDMKLLLSKVPNPELYGNAIIEGQKVKGLVEKPESPSSDIIVNSAYRLNHEFIKKLASDGGDEQYKLERVLSEYLHTHPSDFEMIPKEEIPSLKYPWDALSVMERLLEEVKTKFKGTVSERAHIHGDVFVDEGAIVMDGAMIEGPAYIGRGAVVGTSALVRQSSLEAGSVVGFGSEVARSLIGPGTKLHHGFVGDCVLGPRVWLGFGFISANRRFDKQPVKAEVKGQKASTNRGHFGCVIGEGTKFGIRGSAMPGVLIGKKVTVGPNTSINTNVPDGKTIYAKQEIVMK